MLCTWEDSVVFIRILSIASVILASAMFLLSYMQLEILCCTILSSFQYFWLRLCPVFFKNLQHTFLSCEGVLVFCVISLWNWLRSLVSGIDRLCFELMLNLQNVEDMDVSYVAFAVVCSLFSGVCGRYVMEFNFSVWRSILCFSVFA